MSVTRIYSKRDVLLSPEYGRHNQKKIFGTGDAKCSSFCERLIFNNQIVDQDPVGEEVVLVSIDSAQL